MMRTLSVLLAVLLSGQTLAEQLSASEASYLKKATVSPDSSRKLPIGGMNMVQFGGTASFVSDNGRFVITGGNLVDLWMNEKVSTVADFDRLAGKIPWKEMKLPLKELATIDYGTGAKEVVIFVDPLCGHCHDQLKVLSELKDEYKFHVVVIPVIGQEKSQEITKRLLAEKNRDKQFDALLNRKWDSLPAPVQGMDILPIPKSLATARILGITSVPVILAPNGKIQVGANKSADSFRKWLKAEES